MKQIFLVLFAFAWLCIQSNVVYVDASFLHFASRGETASKKALSIPKTQGLYSEVHPSSGGSSDIFSSREGLVTGKDSSMKGLTRDSDQTSQSGESSVSGHSSAGHSGEVDLTPYDPKSYNNVELFLRLWPGEPPSYIPRKSPGQTAQFDSHSGPKTDSAGNHITLRRLMDEEDAADKKAIHEKTMSSNSGKTEETPGRDQEKALPKTENGELRVSEMNVKPAQQTAASTREIPAAGSVEEKKAKLLMEADVDDLDSQKEQEIINTMNQLFPAYESAPAPPPMAMPAPPRNGFLKRILRVKHRHSSHKL